MKTVFLHGNVLDVENRRILPDHGILVEDGRIVELGSHEDLMAKNGAYAALVHTQELRHG